MINAKELIKLTNSLTILFVEDEKKAQDEMKEILEDFFKEVIIAKDGEDGLEAFKKNLPDLVITDIQMPKKDGIEMSKEIKAINRDIPIIVMTAFSDQKYFIDSIDLGVDKYILKPIDGQKVKEALYIVAQNINDKKIAEEYIQKQKQQSINQATIKIMEDMTELNPNPSIILIYNRIKFLNKAFENLFDSETIDKLEKNEIEIDDLFEKRDGFLNHLSDISENIRKNKFSIRGIDGKNRIFSAIKNEIILDDGEVNTLYTFNETTIIEYQKTKIKNYLELIKDYFSTPSYRPCPPDDNGILKDVSSRTIKIKEEINIVEELLKREHSKSKISAIDYIKELNEVDLENIEELKEIEKELDILLFNLEKDNSMNILMEVSKTFYNYSSNIANLIEFEGLVRAIKLVSIFANDIEEENLNLNSKKIINLLRAFLDDLINWRINIFENRDIEDIHFLDSSLLSSVISFKESFLKEENIEVGELELF